MAAASSATVCGKVYVEGTPVTTVTNSFAVVKLIVTVRVGVSLSGVMIRAKDALPSASNVRVNSVAVVSPSTFAVALSLHATFTVISVPTAVPYRSSILQASEPDRSLVTSTG